MIVCARIRSTGRQAEFQADEQEIRRGDTVIADVETGLDSAVVLSVNREDETVENDKPERPHIHRRATEEDLRQIEENERFEKEGRHYCHEKVQSRNLPMKVVETSITFDKKKFVFFFTAEKRVDFRELVKDLATRFRTRIELRQIGIRDEAKLVGGIGCCGREVCCRLFLTQFAPISIKMAKGQDIALNPNKISGLCGRLMCCLGYEQDAGGGQRRKDRRPAHGERPAATAEEITAEPVTAEAIPSGETVQEAAAEAASRPEKPERQDRPERPERPPRRPEGEGRRDQRDPQRPPRRDDQRQQGPRDGQRQGPRPQGDRRQEHRPDQKQDQRSDRPPRQDDQRQPRGGDKRQADQHRQHPRPPRHQQAPPQTQGQPQHRPEKPADAQPVTGQGRPEGQEGSGRHHRRRRRGNRPPQSGGPGSGG